MQSVTVCLDCCLYPTTPCETHGPHIASAGDSSWPLALTEVGRRYVEEIARGCSSGLDVAPGGSAGSPLFAEIEGYGS